MNIDEAISHAQTFGEIQRVSAVSSAHLSCLGSRYITAEGYEGTAHIDAIAYRTMALLKQFRYEFNVVDREQGKLLSNDIERLYSDSRNHLFDSSCFTKTITLLRKLITGLCEHFIFGKESVEYEWHRLGQSQNTDFWRYTRIQFISRFGFSPEEATNVEMISARDDCPQRWEVPFNENVRRV